MDIAGAKALRERLGEKSEEDTTPPGRVTSRRRSAVFHWTGVSQPGLKADRDDTSVDRGVSKFLRLGLSFR
jgi:hypothetical protein